MISPAGLQQSDHHSTGNESFLSTPDSIQVRVGTRGSQPKAFTERQLNSSSLTAYSLLPTVYFYHTDHLGSPRIITNLAGEKVAEYEYLPFGFKKNGKRSVAPFAFTGKPKDQESGLQYFGARYYDQILRRFMSVDPLEQPNYKQPQNLNRYTYCYNKPTRGFDPDGKYYFDLSSGEYKAWSRMKEDVYSELICRSLIPGYGLITDLHAKISDKDPRISWSNIFVEAAMTVLGFFPVAGYNAQMIRRSLQATETIATGVHLFIEVETDKLIFRMLKIIYPERVMKSTLPPNKGRFMFKIASFTELTSEGPSWKKRKAEILKLEKFARVLFKYNYKRENIPVYIQKQGWFKKYWSIYERLHNE